jgi:hypothetical protein
MRCGVAIVAGGARADFLLAGVRVVDVGRQEAAEVICHPRVDGDCRAVRGTRQ